MDFNTIMNYVFLGNTGEAYLVSFFIFAELVIVFKVFKLLVVRRLKKMAKSSDNDVDDFIISLVETIKFPFYIYISFYLATELLTLSGNIERFLNIVLFIVIVIQGVLLLQKTIDYGVRKFFLEPGGLEKGDEDKEKEIITRMASGGVKIALWVIGGLLVLSNVGINVTSLITGLGIGGIAIALAIQNILEDIFTSFSILMDKPFQVGDFIELDQQTRGTVKRIGVKTTRIKNPQGEEIVVANKDLTSARLHNFKRMEKRKVVFFINIVYGTDTKKLKKIAEIVRRVVNKIEGAEFDRTHFKEYADFSLRYEISYFVKSSKYVDYLDAQEKVNLGMYDAFKKEGIQFAYPTQEVIMKRRK